MVYKGWDNVLKRFVAIKIPHRHRVTSGQDFSRYLEEAQSLARLDHPGIVQVFEFGKMDDGLCFVVSKYVEGSDLKARMKAGSVALRQAAEIVAGVAAALHHAHQRGVVHRDIKPANILLDSRALSIVVDFGLALLDEKVDEALRFAGTTRYMSPEQARGRPQGRCTQRHLQPRGRVV